MNINIHKDMWDALLHGLVAGILVLLLDGIGRYVFEAPAIPFVYGLAAAMVALVTAVRLYAQHNAGSRREI
jgi:hypothetical protein